MNKIKLPKSLLVLLAAPAMLALTLPISPLRAQSQTETKIRLMADALRARDSGDLATAKKNLEDLLVLAPNDATVQRLLGNVNTALENRGGNSAPAVGGADMQVASAPAAEAPAALEEPTQVAYPKPGKPKPILSPEQAAVSEADALVKQEEGRIDGLVSEAQAQSKIARGQSKDGNFDGAAATLEAAIKTLPDNANTKEVIADLQAEKNGLLLEKAQYLLKQGDTDGATEALKAYSTVSPDSKKAAKVAKSINRAELNPEIPSIEKSSPGFIADQKEIAKFVAKGRGQYLAGDADGAQESFRQVEIIDPNNAEAKYFLSRIAKEKAEIGKLNLDKTRNQMLEEVANAWQRPGVYQDRGTTRGAAVKSPLEQKINSIQIPSVNFNNVELSKVVSTLTAISEEFDTAAGPGKGANIVLLDPQNKNPAVTITLRNLTLKRVLDFITTATGYQYEIQEDAVVVRPGGDKNTSLETAFFAVTKSTVIRMTGIGAASTTSTAPLDPFATAPTGGASSSGGGGEGAALRGFLQQAGVNFDTTEGSSLAYDGASIIVTQTSRNIERIRNILNRYNDVKQVEIEAKFMDVQEGALEELGVNWAAKQNNRNIGSLISGVADGRNISSNNRNLAGSFTSIATGTPGTITSAERTTTELQDIGNGFFRLVPVTTPAVNRTITNNPPSIPGAPQLGSNQSDFLSGSARLGLFDVTAVIRALSQKSGSDLLSAPKVTVLSGNPANIIVAQELRYPQSYGETQSTVSAGNSSAGGGSVSITAGVPQEFTTRNVGVELKVTPTVEEDDYSISLDLNPKVTEFEGFVEYGGQSVAVTSSTTVTVPSGFYQPVFSTREITTKVTVWDGATLVLGGLTREDVKKTSDKVPVLGDIPFIGRAFRSKGESSQKRNLLIFVTANLVSPGGSPKKQNLRNTPASSLFQNPTVVTPASAEPRTRSGNSNTK
jgi:general secretion pathway protein D